ncbi:hypothetical protein FDP41_009349 [Naegleria fowleri]|uniref:Uncharacterized protein n=1 Tax=Naegleria fowleri TaxID=5763 RepID=A0A6A5BCN8_NAEFO|nr:uncharacterized protein FDP41_009349 [Naegleria fowleri]KAF0972446.1 hypothetical protein FDP41_009349 [Naegleria fowleri]CAG4719360.1 unnamed protein product [Naegleria fowleri]
MISSASSNQTNSMTLISSEDEENKRKLEISFSKTVPAFNNTFDDEAHHDEQMSASEQEEELFEIHPLSSTVLAISLKESPINNPQVAATRTDEIVRVLSKALSNYYHPKTKNSIPITHSKKQNLLRLDKVMELLKQFTEWAKENAWEVFLFRLFDCIIVFCVLFFMKHLLPKSVTRVLEWFIDPLVDFEGFPFSN